MIKQMTQKISKKAVLITATVTAAILIIAVIVLCVCMFVRADKYYAEARLLDRAVIESTSIAETLKASHGDLTKASQLMTSHSQIDITENTLTLYYDDKLNPTSQAAHTCRAVITRTSISDAGNAFEYTISFFATDTGAEFYSITFKAL